MGEDPMAKIESDHSIRDIGRMGALVYAGALDESQDHVVAFMVAAAYFTGMFRSSQEPKAEDA